MQTLESLVKPGRSRPFQVAIFAAETSADLIAARLIFGLKEHIPEISIWGVFGTEVEKTHALHSYIPISQFLVMGFADVLKRIIPITYNFYRLKKQILKQNPDMVIFIDGPAFGMRLAKSLRKSRFKGKIVQIVAPTVWAYHPERAQTMAQSFDLLYTLFDFEVPYFEKAGLQTLSIGHPTISQFLDQRPGIKKEKLLALFPGSRPGEIKRNLPLLIEGAQRFLQRHPNFQAAVVKSPAMKEGDSRSIQGLPGFSVVEFRDRYDLMKRASLALTKSGTVTLELAIFQVPTAVVYVLSKINLLFAKYILKLNLPFYSLANILLQRKLQPELIYPTPTSDEIACTLEKLLLSKKEAEEGAYALELLLRKHPDPISELTRHLCNEIQKT